MYKIAVIIPYFGSFPIWMPLFVETCRRNPNIDFIFYSDCEEINGLNNIHFHKMTWTGYCDFVSRKLEFDFYPKSPYKLCALRPFYALLHEEDLKGYDFWGFGDIDLMLGDTSKYLTDVVLTKYDVISTCGDRVSGPLFFMRNNEYYRTLGLKIRGWKEKLQSEKNIPLDEKYLSDKIVPEAKMCRGIYYKLRDWFKVKTAYSVYYSIVVPLVSMLTMQKKRRLCFVQHEATPEMDVHVMRYVYRDGHIYDSEGNELMYLHFLFFKKNIYREENLWKDGTEIYNAKKIDFGHEIYIDENGIHNR